MRWTRPADQATRDDLVAIGYGDRTWDAPQFLPLGQLRTEERMPTAILEPDRTPIPLPDGRPLDLDGLAVTDPLTGREISFGDLLQRRLFNDGLLVFHDGAVRHESYRAGLRPDDRHLLHSVSKTLTTMMIGIAAEEGTIDVDEPVRSYVPDLTAGAWDGVTVQHVLDMAVGIATDEHYEDPGSMYWRYAELVGYYGGAPADGGALRFVVERLVERTSAPGDVFNYASYLTNLLPMCLAAAYGRSAIELYEERLFRPVGPETEGAINCDGVGTPITEGQLNLTLRDLTRWALLLLDDGRNLAGEQVLPVSWVDATFASSPARRAAFLRSGHAEVFESAEYHNQTWVIDPPAGRAAMLGIHGQFVLVDRPNRLLVAGLASYPTQVDPLMTASVRTVWDTVQRAVDA